MRLFGKKRFTAISTTRKKDLPSGLWIKCPECNEIVYTNEIKTEKGVCPKCSYHFSMKCDERLELLVEPGSFEEWDGNLVSADPLVFTGKASYVEKLTDNRKKTGLKDAVICGRARMGASEIAIGVMDFRFIGGSMGSVVGEKITRLIENATKNKLPLIIVCASSGARMYEGMLSLMQMAKTSAALAYHSVAQLPYISVLTNPTTAGVMASFATLGDVIIAEPHALIAFAGPRVIKQTTQEDIPNGFQRSEFVLKHGLIDMIVHRKEMKKTLIQLLAFMDSSSTKPQKQAIFS